MVFAYFRISSCRGVLRQHINRINYIFEIWKSEHIANPEIPEPAEIHGWTLVNGNLEPLWIIGNILPDLVGDLVKDINTDGDHEDSEAGKDEDNEGDVADDVILGQ